MLILLAACLGGDKAEVLGVAYRWEDAGGTVASKTESLVVFNDMGEAWTVDPATGEFTLASAQPVYDAANCEGARFIPAPVPLTPILVNGEILVRTVDQRAVDRSVVSQVQRIDGQNVCVDLRGDSAVQVLSVLVDDMVEAGEQPPQQWSGALHRVMIGGGLL